MVSLAPRHTIFFQTQMAPLGLRSLIPYVSSLGALPCCPWLPWCAPLPCCLAAACRWQP